MVGKAGGAELVLMDLGRRKEEGGKGGMYVCESGVDCMGRLLFLAFLHRKFPEEEICIRSVFLEEGERFKLRRFCTSFLSDYK